VALFKRPTPLGAAPVEGRELILADLDGVVYRGALAIPRAVEQLNAAAATVRVGYLTNNASRTNVAVAEQLRGFGLQLEVSDVVTSPQAATALLARTVAPGSKVLVVGGEGLVDELTKAGFVVTRSADDNPDAVVQGFAPHIGWEDLAEACFALAEQPGKDPLPWIATNAAA